MQALRILVVDDEEDILEIFRAVLEEEGHHVTTAESGEAALAALGAGTFDLVFLDIKLPGLSGIEVLKEIRRAHREKPKVVMITGVLDDDVYDLSIYSGHAANGFLTKPCTFQAIKDCIRKVCTEDASYIHTPRDEYRYAATKLQKTLHAEKLTLATVEVLTGGLLARALATSHPFGAEYRGGVLVHAPSCPALPGPAVDLLAPTGPQELAGRVRTALGADLGLALVLQSEDAPGSGPDSTGTCRVALWGPLGAASAEHRFATRGEELAREAAYFAMIRFHMLFPAATGSGLGG